MKLPRVFLRLAREEDAVALVTVMLISFVVLSLVGSLMAYAVGSMSLSRHDQDWNASLSASEAGLDDYLYRLNQDGNYWQYSGTVPPPDGNLAFTQYVPVPGPSNEGRFRYIADTSTVSIDGAIKLTVTGTVRDTTRTIQATVRRRSFLDYLYFTDYETKDPAAYTRPPDPISPTEAQAQCARHYYEGRTAPCVEIFFSNRDTVDGPLHSNDAININGNPQFNGDTSTSWDDPTGRRWRGTGNPRFASSGDPRYAAPLTMPPTNSSIKSKTDPVLGGRGCLYTGPTQVTLNSTGTMNVVSPFTRSTNVGCGPGANLQLPSNGVIYVQNVPSGPSDPNYANGCPHSGGYPPGLPVPISGDLTVYGCRDGDAFVSGTLRGQLTIAAEHDVVIVDHTRYAGGTTGLDVLGLVANNYVEVHHPVRCLQATSSCNLQRATGGLFLNPVIQAAVVSVQHSFIVQNYQSGNPLANLYVTGAIAQRYRGPVGTFNPQSGAQVSGYMKAYVYDGRLRYLSPPHFLDPVASAWQIATWAESATPIYP